MYFLGSYSEYGSSHNNWIQLVERGKKGTFCGFFVLYVGIIWVKMMSKYNAIYLVKYIWWNKICQPLKICFVLVGFLNKTIYIFQYEVFDNLIC